MLLSAASMLACPLLSCTNKCVSTKVAKIAQIESHTLACLSMTEMQAMTQSVYNDVIDAFGTSITIANKFAIRVLGFCNRTKCTIAMFHSRFVAVSRCSILTPAGPTKGQLCEA